MMRSMKKTISQEVSKQIAESNQKNFVVSAAFGLGSLALSSLVAISSNRKLKKSITSDMSEVTDTFVNNMNSINEALNNSARDRDDVLSSIAKSMERQSAVFESMNFVCDEEAYDDETDPSSPDPDAED